MTRVKVKREKLPIIADAVTGRDLMERGLAVTLYGDYDSAVLEIYSMEDGK